MKELIEKIDVCEPAVEQALKWLSESGNNGLNEGGICDILRYLLRAGLNTVAQQGQQLRAEGYYVLTAYRYGNRELHSYVVDLCRSIDEAKERAEVEVNDRGGKYSVVVVAKNLSSGLMDEVYELECPNQYKD